MSAANAAGSPVASAGFLSGFWSRLRASASSFCRRGDASGGDEDDDVEEEATVRSRIERRAAAASRVGRKLAVVSFNLEVLVFIYTFWKARRRNLCWRQPVQALSMLLIPALATIIYTAFVRFTRMSDAKDKKMLEKLQDEKQANNCGPKECDQNKTHGDMDDAVNSMAATDSMEETDMLRKCRGSNFDLRDDVGSDTSWGHSKEQLLTATSNDAAISSFDKEIHTSLCDFSEHYCQSNYTSPISGSSVSSKMNLKLSARDKNEETLACSAQSNLHKDTSIFTKELPAGGSEEGEPDGLLEGDNTCSSSSKETPISPVDSHNSYYEADDSCCTKHGTPFLSTTFQKLLLKVSEENSLPLPEKIEFSPSTKEAPESPLAYSVAHSSSNDFSLNASDLVLSASQTFEKLPAEGGKEEALVGPHNPMMLQLVSFTPEKITTTCVLTHSCPSVCNNAYNNATDVNFVTVSPALNLELFGEGGKEKESSKLHVPEESGIPLNLEKEILLCPREVGNTEHCLETSVFSLCSQEAEMMEGAGGFSFIKVSPELNFSASPELIAEDDKDDKVKELCVLHTPEENDIPINLEKEALLGPLVVGTAEQCLETSGFSLCSQEAKMMEVPGLFSLITVSPELNCPASPELLAEGNEDVKQKESSNLLSAEDNGLPFNLGPLVFDAAECCLATSGLSLNSQDAKMMEIPRGVKEGLPESQDERAFNHLKEVVTSSDDTSNAHNLTNNLKSAQFIPEVNITEALKHGQEALSEPLPESTSDSKGIFLSPNVINNDGIYSSNLNSYLLFANKIKDDTLLAGQGGLSESEDEITLTFLETSISPDEDTSAENYINYSTSSRYLLEGNKTDSLQDGKQAPSDTLERVPFSFEENFVSPDEGINSEKYSLYSRSSSYVSEVNMMEDLKGVASSKPEDENDYNFEERASVMFPEANNIENYTENSESAHFIAEVNIMQTLQGAKEASVGSLHEVSFNFEDTFISPDAGNHMENYSDLSSFSCNPAADAFEALQTGQEGFSKPHYENNFASQETSVHPKMINNAENYWSNSSPAEYVLDWSNTTGSLQGDGKTLSEALQVGQEWFSESQHENDFTLQGTSMCAEEINSAENYLSKSGRTDCASDLPNTVETLQHIKRSSLDSLHQDTFSAKESPVSPDEGSKAKNHSDNIEPSLNFTVVNFIESLGGDHEQTLEQQDEAIFRFEDNSMVHRETISENDIHFNISGSQHISDANMMETLQDGMKASSKMLHNNIISFEETSISQDDSNYAENCSNNSGSVLQITEINIRAAPLAGEEGTCGSRGEEAKSSISPNDVDNVEATSLKPAYYITEATILEALPDVNKPPAELKSENSFRFFEASISSDEGNKARNHSDYSKSLLSVPVDNLMEVLAACQEVSSEPQDEICSSLEYRSNTMEILQDGEKALSEALQSGQEELSESQHENDFTSVFPEEINNAESYLSKSGPAEYASNLLNTVESLQDSKKALSKSLYQGNFSFEEPLVALNEGSKAEHSDNNKPSLCFREPHLSESLCGNLEGTLEQQDEAIICVGDTSMAHQKATTENKSHFNILGSQHNPDANMMEILQGGEKASSDMLHDNICSIARTSISPDDGSNSENCSNNSGSVLHITGINMAAALLVGHEGPLKLQDEIVNSSTSPDNVDYAETHILKPSCNITEVTMMLPLRDVKEALGESQDENSLSFVETSISSDEGNNVKDQSYNVMEVPAAGLEGSSEPLDEDCSSFDETRTEVSRGAKKFSSVPRAISCTTTVKEAIRSAEKGSPKPLPKGIGNFDKTLVCQERANNSPNENAHSSKQTAILQDECSSNKSKLSSCTPKANSIEGPEMALSPRATSLFLHEIKDAENKSWNSSSVSCHHEVSIVQAPQELPTGAGSEKVFFEDKKARDWLSTDEEPKGDEFEDTTYDAEDLAENNPVDPLEVTKVTSAVASKPSVKLYAKDTSWRDSAMWTSSDFEVARVAGLRQRKPVFTISNSTVSSTESEPADEQSTEPVDDTTEILSVSLPSFASNVQNRLNDMPVQISVQHSTTEVPRKSI